MNKNRPTGEPVSGFKTLSVAEARILGKEKRSKTPPTEGLISVVFDLLCVFLARPPLMLVVHFIAVYSTLFSYMWSTSDLSLAPIFVFASLIAPFCTLVSFLPYLFSYWIVMLGTKVIYFIDEEFILQKN